MVPGRVRVHIQRKNFNRILIHIYLQSMFRLSFQSNAFKSIPNDKAYCYIVGLGINCKFIDLLFKRLVITFIKISFLNCFIVSEIIYSQTDTLTEELMYLR